MNLIKPLCSILLLITFVPLLAETDKPSSEINIFYAAGNTTKTKLPDATQTDLEVKGKVKAINEMNSMQQYDENSDKKSEGAYSHIEILDSNYTSKILIDNTYPLGDLAINPRDNRLVCFQEAPYRWWSVYELVDGKLEERYGTALSEFPHGKIEFTFDNKMVVTADTEETTIIKVYGWPTSKLEDPIWYITKPRERFGWIVDIAVHIVNNKLYLTSSNGETYILDVEEQSLKKSEYLKGVVREYYLGVILGEWHPPGICNAFSVVRLGNMQGRQLPETCLAICRRRF